MTKLLEQAMERVAQLSPQEQDAIAGWLLEEIASERKWDRAFSSSEDVLSKLASEALLEHRAGDTQDLESGAQ